jgi:hypothetical protein
VLTHDRGWKARTLGLVLALEEQEVALSLVVRVRELELARGKAMMYTRVQH